MNLPDLACFGDRRHSQVISSSPEAKLVLFSLRDGQEVKGRGEPRVHMVALSGSGQLWSDSERMTAQAGTLLAVGPGEQHGAVAGDGEFLVLGIITPTP